MEFSEFLDHFQPKGSLSRSVRCHWPAPLATGSTIGARLLNFSSFEVGR